MRLAGLFFSLLLPSLAAAAPITLKTTDGVVLSADVQGSGTHGVVLLHEDGGNKEAWKELAETLGKNDCVVISLDLRGHGASKGTLDEAAYPKMVEDVRAAITWLESKHVADVNLVGAELGANLALSATAAIPEVTTVTLLSPSLSSHGLKVSSALANLGQRPILLVASRDDASSARAAQLIHDKATGPKHLALYDGNAKGRRMLNTAPALEGLMLSWVNGSFLQANDPRRATSAAVETEIEEIETTGERFEDKH